MRLFKLLDRLLNVTLLTQSRDGLMGADYKWHQLLGEAPRGSSSDSVFCVKLNFHAGFRFVW